MAGLAIAIAVAAKIKEDMIGVVIRRFLIVASLTVASV